LDLNPFQERYLLGTLSSKQNLVVTGNQVGKTVTLAILHIWWNYYKIGISGDPNVVSKAYIRTLNISPVSRQSKEAFRYIEEILHSQFTWEKDGKRYVNRCKIEGFMKGKNENLGRIDFSNNTSVFCLSTKEDRGAALQGAQFPLITYDECVQSYHLADELPARIFSRVAKYNGRVDLISTPDEQAHSQQYWYHLYSEAEKGESDWKLFIGVYDENIFIPEEDREEYKKRLKKLSPERYEQVVYGKFVVSEASVFTPEMIESLWNGRREPTPPKPDHTYVISIDWGVSDQGDETVMLVADDTDPNNAEIVHAYYKRGGDPADLIAMAAYLKDEYNDAKIIMDVASMGGAIFRKRMRKMQPLSFPTDQKGVAIAYAKMRLRNNLRENLLTQKDESGNGRIRSYYLHKLESQLASYRIDDKKLKQDWVMAFVQLCWYLEEYRTKKKISVYPLRYFNEHKSID